MGYWFDIDSTVLLSAKKRNLAPLGHTRATAILDLAPGPLVFPGKVLETTRFASRRPDRLLDLPKVSSSACLMRACSRRVDITYVWICKLCSDLSAGTMGRGCLLGVAMKIFNVHG